jgi:hypothetical protein
MKIDTSLQEVWEWKDKCHEEYKDKTWDERIEMMNKNAEDLKKNYNLKLRVAGSKEELRLTKTS